MAEASRRNSAPASITDDIVLSRKYFQEAVALDPADARKLGFLGGTMVAEGTGRPEREVDSPRRLHHARRDRGVAGVQPVHRRLRHEPDAERLALNSVRRWSGSGGRSTWCRDEVDRENPDYRKAMTLETQHGVKRACWNSWIAPYNFEGFFLNMGDMLVKSGRLENRAEGLRDCAALAHSTPHGLYRSVLEERVRRAPENVARYSTRPRPAAAPDS